MKKTITLICLLFTSYTFAQGTQDKEITEDAAETLGNIKSKNLKIGISLGFNRLFDKVYDARISPLDSTLHLQGISNTSFLISTTISYPLSKVGKYYRKVVDGQEIGDPYFVSSGFNLIATVNLVTFNAAIGGGGLFNQKLDGGLGIGYDVGNKVQIAATYEMLSFLQPRESITKYDGKQLIINGTTLTSLPVDNKDYFTSKYLPSVSLKLIYTIN